MGKVDNQSGITIPELILAITLSGLMLALIMSFMFSYWSFGTAVGSDLDAFVDRLNASDFLREYLGASSGLIIQNSIADQHPNSIDSSVSPANYWLPIHATPGTYNAPTSGAQPILYFKRPALDTTKAYIMNGSNPYEDEFMLFIDSTRQLTMRTLANPNANGDAQKTSCPAGFVTTSCPADKVLMSNVASIATRYFSKSGGTIDYTSSTDPNTGQYNGPDAPLVEVVELTITLSYKPVFSQQTTSNNTVIRIALRNN